MDTLEKTEFNASIRHIAIFLKSGIPIHNSEDPDKAGKNTRRRKWRSEWKRKRTQEIAKRYAFHASTKSILKVF